MDQVNRYHKFLRVSAVVAAAVLVFDGGFLSPISKQLSDTTVQYLASSIGVIAQVEPNEFNEITAELTAREKALGEREAALAEREISTRSFGDATEQDYSVYILSSILFILTVLIVLNYAMDWSRDRRVIHEGKPV